VPHALDARVAWIDEVEGSFHGGLVEQWPCRHEELCAPGLLAQDVCAPATKQSQRVALLRVQRADRGAGDGAPARHGARVTVRSRQRAAAIFFQAGRSRRCVRPALDIGAP
jgi:hypothetical protein